MEFTIWISLGYVIGWIAPDILQITSEKYMIFYILLGIIGSVLSGIVTNMFLSNFTFFNTFVSALGALIFIQLGSKLNKI